MDSPHIDFSQLRFLIIENHHLMRRLLREMLQGFGARQVSEAASVPDAFSLIYRASFDVVILDFFLGEMDGADFAWRVRRDPACRNRETPILLITGLPEHHKVLKVRDAGVDSVLAKPVAPKDLYLRLAGMLSQPRPFVVTKAYVGPDRKPEIRRAIAARAVALPSRTSDDRSRAVASVEAVEILLLTKTVATAPSGKTH